jgi:hypothetical protein
MGNADFGGLKYGGDFSARSWHAVTPNGPV